MKTLNKFLPLVQIIFLSSCVAFWTLSFPLVEKADTYFVMNIGRYVMESGFPHVDPFTIHENLQLVAQQWLSGIFFWEAYKFFGVDGIRLLDCVIGIILVVIYWRLCLMVSGGNKILSLALSFAVSLLVVPAIVPRPHIISAAILLSEVFFLEKFTRTQDFKFLLALPALSILLINFHAAMWLMMFVVSLPFFFVKSVQHAKILLAAMAAVFLCGLINPYGLDAMTYVMHSYGIDSINSGVVEMQTPTAHNMHGKIFYLSATLMIFALTKFKVPWRYIFLSGGLMFMAVMHGRNLILYYLLATFPLAYAWRNFKPEKFFSGDEQYKNRGVMTLIFFLLLTINTVVIVNFLKDGLAKLSLPLEILLAVASLFLLYNLFVVRFEGRVLHPAILPRKNLSLLVVALIIGGMFSTTFELDKRKADSTYTNALKFLLRTERPENISLYVNQGYGGLAGMFGIKYYIDSRSEVFLPANNGQKNILEEYLDLRHGKIYYADFFARYNFTHIITDSEDYFLYEQLSRDKIFRVVYESERVEGYKVIRCKIFVPRIGD